MRRQSSELAGQQAENERLAGLVRADSSRINSPAELLSIRSEVESLRKQTNSLAGSLEENRRLRAANVQQANASLSILQMREEDQKWGIGRMNYTRHWLIAFDNFANDHGKRFPNNFDEARQYFAKEEITETNFTEEQFEILYRGPATNITSPSLVIVLREKQPRRSYDGKLSRAYGFADGHSEVTLGRDGNFDAWEKRHIILPPPTQ